MVAGGGADEYTQIGFARLPGMSTPSRFVEWSDGVNETGWARTFYNGYSLGTNHFYEVLFSFAGPPRKFTMKVDGNALATTPWSPEGGEWSVGWTGQFFGETLDQGDDVPGVAADKEHFTNVKVVTCWGCGFVVAPSAVGISDLSVYKGAFVTYPNYFDIWTQR